MRFLCFTQNSAILRFSREVQLEDIDRIADIQARIGHGHEINDQIVLHRQPSRVPFSLSRMSKWM